MKLNECKTREERARFIENTLSISLANVQKVTVDSDEIVHCENRIGSITVPLGVAGPFNIRGDHVKGEFYIPLATSEGALVASVSRGAKATFESGILTAGEKVGVTRGPVLKVKSMKDANMLEQWIWENTNVLASQIGETSSHIKLMDITVKKVGLYVYLRFSFDTDFAMGMNMATIATQHLIEYITQKTKTEIITVAGNYDIDKKPAWLNAIYGRGYTVQAESTISSDIVSKVLKTTPERIYEVWKAKCMVGSAISGSIGFNAHHANIVAAFYCATGQDLAHVVEGSLGMTIVEVRPDNSLYISVNLPSILLGTVGGGTKLITQTEARSITKQESPQGLVEVLSAAVLAGELSLLASLSEGTLASSHKKLGR